VLAVTFGNAVKTTSGEMVSRVVDVARSVAAVIPLQFVIELKYQITSEPAACKIVSANPLERTVPLSVVASRVTVPVCALVVFSVVPVETVKKLLLV
jgi:hypothetical protein